MAWRTAEERRTYLRERYNKKMNEYREMLGGKCSKCGSVNDLHFDHINPSDKTFSISRLVANGTKDAVLNELSKCQLLCIACHVSKTTVNKENVRHAKQWQITKSDGTVINCFNLSEWCEQNNYPVQVLRDIARGRPSRKYDIKSVTTVNK